MVDMTLLPSKYDKVMPIMVAEFKTYEYNQLCVLREFCRIQSLVFTNTSIDNIAKICHKLKIAQLLPDIFYIYMQDCFNIIQINRLKR